MKNIIITVFLAFVISFSIFIYFQSIINDELSVREREFFSRTFNQTDSKILLLGSSHVGMLDAEYLQSIINEKHPQYVVYNLGSPADTPEKRSKQIPKILELNPKIIVYGIAYRDFSNYLIDDDKILPDPNIISTNFLKNLDLFPENPKLVTLSLIRTIFDVNVAESFTNLPNTPFYSHGPTTERVTNLNELENQFDPKNNLFRIEQENLNDQINAFEKTLETFENKNIKVIIFITPHNLYYFNSIPESDKKRFDYMIEELKTRHDIPIHSLMLNYSKMNIWASTNHIVHGYEGRIFAQDISNLILQEIKK